MYKKFYHATTKKMIVAFATVFDNILIDLENGREIKVPLRYVQGEKFLDKYAQYTDTQATVKPLTLPAMGFEWTSTNFDTERHTNTMNKLQDRQMAKTRTYSYNRTPVSWQFDLYIVTNRMSDGLKIVEQIIPFFTPHLNLRVRAIEELQEPDNVQLTLTSFSHDINYDGSMDDARTITFQLSFTLHGYLYQDMKRHTSIKKSILNIENMTDSEMQERFMQMIVQAHDDGSITEEIIED